MKPPKFDYHAPSSVDEALALLGRYAGEAQILAGGQSLVPLLNFRLAAPAHLVDINGISGLDRLDRRFLTAIVDYYDGGPVGIEAVAATINDEAETLAELVEPYLLKIGFVIRTPSGRRVTREAYAHLGRTPVGPARAQPGLFEA